MIELPQALQIMSAHVKTLDLEEVKLNNACGRILAEDLYSDLDLPPFNKAAMDGYACKREDLNSPLTIIETIAAGLAPQKQINNGECAKIMTGAEMPKGADCVIMIEHTALDKQGRVIFNEKETLDNFCLQGEDVKTGDLVLTKGTLIKPQHITVLASIGCVTPKVFKKPRVAILVTGDELLEPSQKPQKSKIRDTNSSQLYAQTLAMGCEVSLCQIVQDELESLFKALKDAAKVSDFIMLSGGVSMGEFDLVPLALKKAGFNLLFERVAMKPGKPVKFGISEKICCLGLPGNPVSSFMQFEILAKPFLYQMMGFNFAPLAVQKTLVKTIIRDKNERLEWFPVKFYQENMILPIEHHGSAHINSIASADGLIYLDIGISELKAGAQVNVRPL